MVRSRKKRYYLTMIRLIRAWRMGMAFWKSAGPFKTECRIVRGILALVFLMVVLPLLIKSSGYGTISLVLYLIALGYANFGLKKLSES